MQSKEKPALIVIDMVKDNFDDSRKLPITPLARKTIAPLNHLSRRFREQGWPVVFSTDAFQPEKQPSRNTNSGHDVPGRSLKAAQLLEPSTTSREPPGSAAEVPGKFSIGAAH